MYVYICKIAQIFIYIIYDPVIVDVNAVYVLVMHVHAYKWWWNEIVYQKGS